MRARLALAAALWAAPAAAAKPQWRPKAGELFAPLLADPLQPRTSASYYRRRGDDVADLSAGGALGLVRDRFGDDVSWQYQWEAEAGARARLARNGRTDAAELSAALPLTLRRGDVSCKLSPFYRVADAGRPRFSEAGLRALAALEPWEAVRVYGGASFLLDTAPSPKRWGLQAGLELASSEFAFLGTRARAFAAHDLQAHERVSFNPTAYTVAGLRFPALRTAARAGWLEGRSPYGRSFLGREHRADLTLVFEL